MRGLAPALLLAATMGGCAQAPGAGEGFRMEAGMYVSSSLEVMWRDDLRADEMRFHALYFAPLRLDVRPTGRYGGTTRSDFDAMAESYQEVMHEALAGRFRIEDKPGRYDLTVQAIVADVLRSERLRQNSGGFRLDSGGGTGEAVLIMEFRAGEHLIAEIVTRQNGARLDRALHGRLGRLDLDRTFQPYAARLASTMLQTD